MLSNTKHKIWLIALVLIWHFFISFPLNNNVFSDDKVLSITGKITFSNGEIPAIATISIGSDKVFKQTVSDEDGNYVFHDLTLGNYNILAHGVSKNQAGFFTRENIEIKRDTLIPLVIDIILVSHNND